VIFVNLVKEEEKQLFHDLNNLSAAVAQTQALNFDQTDLFNRLSKEIAVEIPSIKKYGIEKTVKQLSDKRKEVATLAVWNNANRILLNGSSDAEMKRIWNEEWKYEDKKALAKEFWSTLIEVLPDDYTDKTKYMITKSVFLQGLAAWGHKVIVEDKVENWKSIIFQLHGFDWGYQNEIYSKFGGGSLSTIEDKKTKEKSDRFYFKGTRAAIKAIPQALEDFVTSYEVTK